MGCVTSKKDINDLHPNIFEVCNVDDSGKKLCSGQLEVNDVEVVFHQRGKPPITWPLKSLRRYGYDSQVFSFEAGRRCPTGSGIYAFSCDRAERLFNYVQAHVQIRSDDVSTPTGGGGVVGAGGGGGGYLEVNRHSLPRLSIQNGPSRLSSVGSSNGCLSPLTPYANEEMFREEATALKPVVVPEELPEEPLPSTRTPSVSESLEEKASSPVYMNVTPGETWDNGDEVDDERHCYANLAPGDIQSLPRPFIPLPPTIREVNYAELDLESTVPPSPSLPLPESPKPPTEGYVTIDFDRTVALSASVNRTIDTNPEGLRKTRHDSAMTDLVTPTSSRHSASLSD